MSSSKTVKVQTCDLSKVLITVVCGFNLAASDNKGQCCWLEGRGGQGVGRGGTVCPGALHSLAQRRSREDRRRTVAQHDPSHGHAAVAEMEMAALSLAARILGRDSSQEGGAGYY